MPDRQFVVGDGYRYGFNGKENEKSISKNHYDFKDRIYDGKIGRWFCADKYFKDYAPISSYVFALNNPIILSDGDGNKVIGSDGKEVTYTQDEQGVITWSKNATEDVKMLGNALLKTISGKKLFDNMISNNRKIHVHISSPKKGEIDKNISSYLTKSAAAGEIVSKSMFDKISAGQSPSDEDFNKEYKFNEMTGEYTKTSDWDETHILVSLKEIRILAALNEDIRKFSPEQAMDLAVIFIAGEEAIHSIQSYGDFYQKKKDSQTGKYVENKKPNTGVEYESRRHEKAAKDEKQIIYEEYIKSQ